jgi:hypothetical protein
VKNAMPEVGLLYKRSFLRALLSHVAELAWRKEKTLYGIWKYCPTFGSGENTKLSCAPPN